MLFLSRLRPGLGIWSVATTRIGFWIWIWSIRHSTGAGSDWKTQLVSYDWSNNTTAIDVKMDGPVLEEKSSFNMLGLTYSSKFDLRSYIIFITETASKKIGALIHSMNFLSPEVALYLYKSIIWSCMEYCCRVWVGSPWCYLEFLDKLQKHAGLLALTLVPLLKPWLTLEI